ncbi:cytochrome c oxidase assembly protein COX16 homolog l(3)neo43 isoform X2 [Dermatophagoides farinae]|uniref:cytochrome c oxidase assembly protein COX16 homolog l(3)neo43 isoform X2 n=1 Tax=Dermatophagoides farinae TaxID=6954 RepID=UPI001F0E7C1B|nr:cytochrome c oxidase assembly protein COX16 homolog, mitochondrial-like isoform X2 [Dermatophagoides farinae]
MVFRFWYFSFMVLGSFLLREFTSIRYEVYNYRRRYVGTKRRDLDYVDDDEKSDEVTTTTAAANNDNETLKELIELGRNDEWKNVRGPRPWEDNREYKEMVDKVVNKKTTTATTTKSI